MLKLKYYDEKYFSRIARWLQGEVQHTLWCGGKFAYPLTETSFNRVLEQMKREDGGKAMMAAVDDYPPLAFLYYSINRQTKEARLRFLVVNPDAAKGVAEEVVNLAVQYAFCLDKADCVAADVFFPNTSVIRCLLKAGFVPRSAEENALRFHDQKWHRYNMVIYRK